MKIFSVSRRGVTVNWKAPSLGERAWPILGYEATPPVRTHARIHDLTFLTKQRLDIQALDIIFLRRSRASRAWISCGVFWEGEKI